MKKTLLILWILFISLTPVNRIQALSVADFTPILDKKVAKMATTEEKVDYLRSFSKSLDDKKYTQDKNARLYRQVKEYSLNMLRVFESELEAEQAKSWSRTQINSKKSSSKNTTKITTNLPHISDTITNIDVEKVRDAVLSRHNSERSSIWLKTYIYNFNLEWTATTRAKKLVESGKTSNLHLRNPGDWYYNYNSMQDWFSGLGVKFPVSVWWAASFSETIWYNTYRCSKSDCTQELINAIKKTWTWLIMKEKTSWGSHYRAAMMKHFTQMWLWIAVDRTHNRYYLVIHYWVDF